MAGDRTELQSSVKGRSDGITGLRQLGCRELFYRMVFVGSGIFKSSDPTRTAEAIVLSTHHFDDATVVAEACEMVGEAMPGLEIDTLETRLDERGW